MMERHVAEKALADLFDASHKINTTLLLIQKECSKAEFRTYRAGAGKAMGYLYTEIIRPILQEHPDLEPEEMKEGSRSQAAQTSTKAASKKSPPPKRGAADDAGSGDRSGARRARAPRGGGGDGARRGKG